MTSSQIGYYAGSAAVEFLTDKFNMKHSKFAYALGKYERKRNSNVGGIVGDYLLEVIADRKHDGVETKRYRLTKPCGSSALPQSISNVVIFDDYVSQSVAATPSDDFAHMRGRMRKKPD